MESLFGRRKKESYAKRYETIWDLGIREVVENDEIIEKQILTSDSIYEIARERIVITSMKNGEKSIPNFFFTF